MITRILRIWIKAPAAIFVILLFFFFGVLNKLVFFFSPYIRKTVAQRNTQWACWMCRHILGYRGLYTHIESIPKGHLLICNHMSYMDVLIIASKVPTLFVTSTEMRDTPFLGWITKLGECLYVNRRSHKNLNQEIQEIQSWIHKGFNVLIFPEATTSNGVHLKPFKSSLLQISQNGTIPITAFCLKYTKLNHFPVDEEALSKTIAWYDDAGFLPHFFKQLSNQSVSFELTQVDNFLSDQFKERKLLVTRLEDKISQAFYQSVSF